MALYHIVLLAIIQGVTEFVPVSSSSHLILFPKLTGVADQGLVIDVAVHVGSLLAVLCFFYRDVLKLTKTFFCYPKAADADKKLLRYVIVSSLPVVLAGAVLYSISPEGLRNVVWIAWASIVFGVVLWVADHFFTAQKEMSALTRKDSILIGLVHVLALFPGVSRSGVTMSMARARGLTRVEAARFSLLIGIPVIAGAGVVGLYDVVRAGNVALGMDALLAVALSFVTAFVSIVLMMRWLGRFGFLPFVLYRIGLGVVILLFFAG